MKRRDKQEEGSNSIFKIFERKKPKQVVGEEVAPKTIRHLERPVKLPFLADMDEGKEQYGSAEDMQDKWGLSEKQATLGGARKRKLLGLAIAFSAFIRVFSISSREYCLICSEEQTSNSSSSLSSILNTMNLITESLSTVRLPS